MKPLTLLLSLTAGVILFASSAFAQRELILPMGDAHYRGQGNTIHLKQQINAKYPGINLRNFRLLKVKVIAKSKHGGGIARLMVGGNEQSRKGIAGNPGNFHRAGGATFDRFFLQNYNAPSRGAWQIKLNGNIKVRRVKVFVQRRNVALTFSSICSHKVNKVVPENDTCIANMGRVKAIRIVGTKQRVNVEKVVVVFGNGQRRQLPALTGGLRNGQKKTVQLGALRNVRRVIVKAVSPRVFKPRGQFQIHLGQR